MLKKLRLKIILAIVLVAAVMLGAILGLFYTLTKQNLRTQSISMIQAIAADPFAPVQPEREPQQVRLPYFVLQTDAFGNLVAIGSSDYDLTDRTFLRMVAAAAQASRDAIGEIPEYSLRYCRVTGSVIFADISSEQQTLRTLLKTGALLVALGLLAFFGLAVLLARSAVRPVEEAWRQQKQFVADASHELKTPLTVVAGFSEMLADDYASCSEDEVAHYLKLICEQNARMQRLIEDLLTLSSLETGSSAPVEERVDLAPMLRSILADAQALSGGRHEISLSIETPSIIKGCANELRSAFGNLAGNAVRYTPQGGKIDLVWRLRDGFGEFIVADTGIGIAPQHLPRLTERFYRVDRSRSRETGGTGLGLAIVKHVLTRHHATLEIESEAGKGSRFVARFPSTILLPG